MSSPFSNALSRCVIMSLERRSLIAIVRMLLLVCQQSTVNAPTALERMFCKWCAMWPRRLIRLQVMATNYLFEKGRLATCYGQDTGTMQAQLSEEARVF